MTTAKRRIVALVAALTALAAIAGPAQGVALRGEDSPQETSRSARLQSAIGVSPAPCADRTFRLLGAKWNETYQWSFRASSTPSALKKSRVAARLQESFDNVTGANNDCGRADKIGATHQYLGTTSRRPNCNSRDGHNVIGFGRMPFGVLAVTCYWIRGGRMVEADLKINSRESWALSLRGCRNRPLLEATITHEAGHVFGLDHVGERRHGRLTMSPFLDGLCQNGESTLGLGDMKGLEALY